MVNINIEEVKKSKGGKLFLAYQEFMRLCNVKRSGIDLCGSNDPQKLRPSNVEFEPFFENREQSDAEHCFGIITLILLVSRFYPELVGPSAFPNLVTMACEHELGENPTGDIPDDGTRNNAQKDADESAYICNFLAMTFGENSAYYKIDSSLFSQTVEKDTFFGMLFYLFDKCEAVLRNLCFEAEGRPGSLLYKKEHTGLGAKDASDMEITGTDLTADNWLCGLLLNEDVRKFEATKTFIGIIQTAAIIVRGQRMEWVDQNFPEFAGS